MGVRRWCEYGQVQADLPEQTSQIDDEVDLEEHAEFSGPCPGCLRKWGDLNGHKLILQVVSDHEGVMECNVGDDLTLNPL